MPGLLDSYIPAVQGFEGFAPRAGWDYKQYTNGYGTKALYPGEVIDRDTAAQRFNTEWGNAASSVNTFAPNAPDGVKAALSSLTFNAGPKWMNSGLGTAIRNGDWETAKNIFLQYNRAGGEVNPGLVSRRQQEAQWFDSSSPPAGRMGLGGPIPAEDAPMPGGLLSAGSNMAKFMPQGASITTGSLPGLAPSAGPAAAMASGGGLLASGVGDKLRAALQDPLFQFGLGVAGAGTEGKGIGAGLLGGSQNANEAFKSALAQRTVQAMQQRDQFIKSLEDPNNPLSRSLSPETLAILKGLPPDQAAPYLGQIFAKNSELQYQRQYTSQLLDQFRKSQGGARSAPVAAPQVGAVEDGYRFKGGNPADPNAWEAVQ